MAIPDNIIHIRGASSSSNSYMVIGERNVLIDSGLPENIENIEAETGKHEGGVGMVLNTHGHYDHFGAGVLLRKMHPGCRIAVHEADAREMAQENSLLTCEQYFGVAHKSIKVDFLLRDGDMVEGTDIEVIHTPGHSPGSVCFYIRKQKILFTGDLIFADGYVGRTDLVGSDEDELLESIERISKLDVDMIFPGHGKPVIGGAGDYIREVAQRLKRGI